jgi:transposase
MQDKDLIGTVLGLRGPWFVSDVRLDVEKKSVDIFLDFERGGRFPCPACGVVCGVHDTEERVWRHLDFFHYVAYLHARVPKVDCEKHSVKQVEVVWARPGSRFSLLFESMILSLAREMSVNMVAGFARVHMDSVWRLLGHYVEEARQTVEFWGLKRVRVDEFSIGKHHRYASVFCDLDSSRVLFVTRGKDKSAVRDFYRYIKGRCDPKEIELFSMDMSRSFISGVAKWFPLARIVFDKFHAVKIVNGALDEVRRGETGANPWLKKTRYLWLKNPSNMNVKEKKRFAKVKDLDCRTARSYQMKIAFQRLWDLDVDAAEQYLDRWCAWALRSKIRPMMTAGKTIKRHVEGILASVETLINNNLLEGTVNKIKTSVKRAYGFKRFENLRTIIYLTGAQLCLPTRC